MSRVFFFFKQKTAYELRISDWSSDVVLFRSPYLITGQSLLVREDNTDITGEASLQNNKKLCSVSGSTPAQRIKDKFPGVQLQQYDTYSACVEEIGRASCRERVCRYV